MEIISNALKRGQETLSEYESKLLLKSYGIPVVEEKRVSDKDEAIKVAKEMGYPCVLKACSPEVAHKTEQGLIKVDLRNERELVKAFVQLEEKAGNFNGDYLVQEMVKGARELVIGMMRDPQFGACVMFGLGGIFTEILKDVTFRVAPIQEADALEMMQEIKGHRILGPVRGLKAVDQEFLSRCLVAMGQLGLEEQHVQEVDVNPMIIRGNKPVAVDALIVLKESH